MDEVHENPQPEIPRENPQPENKNRETLGILLAENLRRKAPKKITKKPKEKPEKPRYLTLPKGIKLRILSQREKNRLGIKENRDKVAPKIKRKGIKVPTKTLNTIRKTSEFWTPNGNEIPLTEVNEKDLDKVVLICGSKKNPVKYRLKEFLRIDPKDIGDAPRGTYFTVNGEYYRKITRLNAKIIKKFGRVHQELERVVNKNTPKKIPRKSVRLYIDENYRTYGENLYNYVKKGRVGKKLKLYSRHTSSDALDLLPVIMIDGVKYPTSVPVKTGKKDKKGNDITVLRKTKYEDILREAVSAEWKKTGGGRGFYTNDRNFHIDARPKKAQWGKW